ncbi:hypothetical protein M407DRAFT_21923 [Tulasnella calospora MUT 4182]|uniref:Uncharacterized protein n=1 Tax=Tulasnella calospora MUT 4182 TaxID=1051891 RepID=A0A0C3L524_9AGAM|nr:hypothetical protein M407DRAFT_21923 [Tulasnella calospora MUT 4182]
MALAILQHNVNETEYNTIPALAHHDLVWDHAIRVERGHLDPHSVGDPRLPSLLGVYPVVSNDRSLVYLTNHDLESWFWVLLHVAIEYPWYRQLDLNQTEDKVAAQWGRKTLESLHHIKSNLVESAKMGTLFYAPSIKLHGQFASCRDFMRHFALNAEAVHKNPPKLPFSPEAVTNLTKYFDIIAEKALEELEKIPEPLQSSQAPCIIGTRTSTSFIGGAKRTASHPSTSIAEDGKSRGSKHARSSTSRDVTSHRP